MKVYYQSNFWTKRNKGHAGRTVKSDWRFFYAGREYRIPAVYCFRKGVTFDIIGILDTQQVRRFFERYGECENRLTQKEIRRAELENPNQPPPMHELWINKSKAETGWNSCDATYIPWAPDTHAPLSVIRDEFTFLQGEDICFSCTRVHVPYPKGIKRFLLTPKLLGLRFTLRKTEQLLPLDIQFDLNMGQESGRTLVFRHPLTGQAHQLYFGEMMQMDLSERSVGAPFPVPPYFTQITYEIDPALPEGDRLDFMDTNYKCASAAGSGACSIGIIGGADGPTAIFVSGSPDTMETPKGAHGLPLNVFCSMPAWQPVDSLHMELNGIHTKQNEAAEFEFRIP